MRLLVDIEKKLDRMTLRAKFTVEQEVLALFGSSGSGKSMILKCIAGLETPDNGRIVLGDRILFDSEKKINLKPQQRRTGYVFQNYALFPNLTVEKNIGLAVPKQKRKQVVAEVIRKFRLEGLEKALPSKLSGGQKQRVALARMFAASPELLLLDEPFSALDQQLAWQLIWEMKEILKETACPVLFVSHNREEVFQLSKRIGVIEQGRMGTVRLAKEMFGRPETIQEAILCGCENIIPLTQELEEVFGVSKHIELKTTNAVEFSEPKELTESNAVEFWKPKGLAETNAVGFYAKDVELMPAENRIPMIGIITKEIEELSGMCYEIALKGKQEVSILMKKSEVMPMKYSNEDGKMIVEVYLPRDRVFLLAGE